MVARACREAGVPNLVHVSSLNAHPDSPSKFYQSKAMGEEAVLNEFETATIVRPSSILGMEGPLFRRIACMPLPITFVTTSALDISLGMRYLPFGMPILNRGQQNLRPVYVSDVAAALSRMATDATLAGKVYEFVGYVRERRICLPPDLTVYPPQTKGIHSSRLA